MSYLPISASRGLVIYKNGQLYESSVTLDFMGLTTTQATKFSDKLNDGTYLNSDISDIGFWADGYLPTNPIFTPAPLSVGLNMAAGISPICSSPFLQQVIPNVGDEIMIKSIEAGSAYGVGFKTRAIVDSHRISISLEWDDNGTRRSSYPTVYVIGEMDNYGETQYWRFFFGIMMDKINRKAYPFIVHGNYYLPYKRGDILRLRVMQIGTAEGERLKQQAYMIFNNLPPEPVPSPYDSNNYGPGENQGGDGDGDDSSDTIAVPATPSLEVITSGMVTIFTPDLTQIQNLANALIDPNFFQALGNVFASLDEVILGLHIVPLLVPYSGPTSAISINLLGIAYRVSIGLYKATTQFIDVDCGTLEVSEYWGNCLDYNPYTKVTIFLPFIGYVDIDADDVMGKTVGIKYRVDIATGACIAFISADGSVMYQYAGNCAIPIPVSSTDQNSAIQNIVSIATAAVTGGAGIAAAGAAVAEAEGALNAASGYKEIKSAISGLDHAKAHYESVSEKNKGKLAGVSANAVVNSKAQFHHGGSLGTSAGFMGIKKPYMIIRRPKQMIPDMYGAFNGYPTNTYAKLDDMVGYTRVSDIRLNIPDATVDEIIECERLLKEGVVL